MLEALYTRHRSWLVGWCTAMTGDALLAEDLVQDTFLRCLEHLHTLKTMSDSQIRAWLKRTAKNRYIDLYRRARAAPEPQPEQSYQDDHSAGLVHALCMTLPEEERQLFILRYFEGYNATELGQMFGLNPSTVRARLASARQKLKVQYLAD